ncbi:unnamed protein product [Closterium sp. Naga37s-1]|nr:unnamed protein product [Closterium sp. Naga37s-1]
MMSYSHSSPLRPSAPHAPHALDAHQRKSPTPPPPAGATHPPFRGPAPAPGPAPHSPLSARGPLSAPPISHPQSHPPSSHPLQSHPPFQPPPPHSPPSRSLPSHPPPSHPPPSLPHPLSHPPLSHPPLSHAPQSHPSLSRPTHPPPGYRPPPQGPPGTAKPAGGATGGAAGGAAAGGRGGVGAAGGALMAEARLVAGDSGQGGGVEMEARLVAGDDGQGGGVEMEARLVAGDDGQGGGVEMERQGSWRAIVDKVVEGYKLAGLAQQLALRGYHVLALMKLRMYGAAAEELTLLGNLDSPQYRYEAHPGMYPGRKGSMLPFALRWLAAELPHRMGNPALTLERLCALQAYCTAKVSHRMGNPAFSFERLCAVKGWQAVRHALVSHHLAQRDYPTALLWLQRLLRYEPSNAALLSRYGLVRLQLGDVEGASAAFGLVEKMVVHREVEMESEGGSGGGGEEGAGEGGGGGGGGGGETAGNASNTAGAEAGAGAGATGAGGGGSDGGVGAGGVTAANVGEMKRLVRLNKALVHFARKEHGQALQLFTAVTKEDPTNSIAANNKALCLMYGRDLATAVRVLEDQLQASPLTAVDETVVLNLCSMYELAASDTLNAKSTLSNWLTRLAPDDFDFACTRL